MKLSGLQGMMVRRHMIVSFGTSGWEAKELSTSATFLVACYRAAEEIAW
jgi:hypothetical protein